MSVFAIDAADQASILRSHFLAPSEMIPYVATMNSGSADFDLVHLATAAITGRGELVAIGYRASSLTTPYTLNGIKTTVDGGSEKDTAAGAGTAWGSAGGVFEYKSTRTGAREVVQWIPMNLHFEVSLLVKASSAASGSNPGYAHAIVRRII